MSFEGQNEIPPDRYNTTDNPGHDTAVNGSYPDIAALTSDQRPGDGSIPLDIDDDFPDDTPPPVEGRSLSAAYRPEGEDSAPDDVPRPSADDIKEEVERVLGDADQGTAEMANNLVEAFGPDEPPEAREARVAELARLLGEQEMLRRHQCGLGGDAAGLPMPPDPFTGPPPEEGGVDPDSKYHEGNLPTFHDYDHAAQEYIRRQFPDLPPDEQLRRAAELKDRLIANDAARTDYQRPTDVTDTARVPEPSPSPEEIAAAQSARALDVAYAVNQVTRNDESGELFAVDRDGIFLPTNGLYIPHILQAVGFGPDMVIADIGSGDGRWPIVAATAFGAEGYGYERSPGRHELAQRVMDTLRNDGVISPEEDARIHLQRTDFTDADVADVDLFTYYVGGGSTIQQIEDKLLAGAKDGARIVYYGKSIPVEHSRLTLVADHIPGLPVNAYVFRLNRDDK